MYLNILRLWENQNYVDDFIEEYIDNHMLECIKFTEVETLQEVFKLILCYILIEYFCLFFISISNKDVWFIVFYLFYLPLLEKLMWLLLLISI